MTRLTVSERQILRKKKIMALYLHWMNVLHVVQWFFKLWEKIIVHGIESSSLGRQLYILDVFVNRKIVHQIAYESDVICFDQLRMNRKAFSNLCIMLETRGGLKASKYLQVDEQVAMFLHMKGGNGSRDIIYPFVDGGYTNCKGFLAPYRGQHYHLNQWEDGNPPRNPQEFFNMKHSSARNVIERCFGAIKNRWAILRSPSFYPIKTQNRIILACCLLHNFIRREMPTHNTDMHPENESDSGDEEDSMDANGSIRSIEASEG
ncbi:uncharacterized protein LOC133784806 [Humulus lupulus]|uniref:uncharacterized protein LOC133784806 n=1 Tax=Humulus lupulus TaxID=3486 RepID=UPI002B4179D6|nr:uncharacterized protein LOC133784806 [Humulus lupulus]